MDIDFPRGGGNLLKSAQLQPVSANDNIFGSKRARKVEVIEPKNPKKRKNVGPALHSFPGLGMAKLSDKDRVVEVEHLSFTKYTNGSLALGYVLQILDKFIIVSLPGGVTGSVPYVEISDSIHETYNGNERLLTSAPNIQTLLTPMQPVRCYVLDKIEDMGKRHLTLSLRGSLVNRGMAFKHFMPGFPLYGCIASTEDHGYVVFTGIGACTCFLPFSAIPSSIGNIVAGQPIECVIESVNEDARIATLRAHRKPVQEAITRGSLLPFNGLVCGMLLNVYVQTVVENGLTVSFLGGSFFGVIDKQSLSRPFPVDDMLATYRTGDLLQARIVFIDHANKSARLSLRPHVIELRGPAQLPALGDSISNSIVTSANKNFGVYLSSLVVSQDDNAADSVIPSSKKLSASAAAKQARREDELRLPVFIHKSTLAPLASPDDSDDVTGAVMDSELIEKRCKPGTSIPDVRVVGYHLVEGCIVGSNMPSHRTDIIHWSQLLVGTRVDAVVESIREFGLIVSINSKISALCPSIHTQDAVLSGKLQKRFKVGQQLRMRVWEVGTDGKVIVTNKKSLVDDSSPILCSYASVERGFVFSGLVSKVSDEGIRIHSYGNVKGFVPTRVLVAQGVTDYSGAFRTGQVVRCVVLFNFDGQESTVKAKTKKALLLGLAYGLAQDVLQALESVSRACIEAELGHAADAPAAVSVENLSSSASASHSDRIVSGTISKIDDSSVQICLDDGRIGTLHKHHCYDFSSTADVIFQRQAQGSYCAFAVGGRIENAIVLSTTQKKRVALSIKPLLLESFLPRNSMEQGGSPRTTVFPSSLSDLQAGEIVVGYIQKIESYGVLVGFRDGLTALAPRSNLADKFLSTAVGLSFGIGDSIRCVVQRVDLSVGRAIVTLKATLVTPSHTFVQSLVSERALSVFTATTLALGEVVACVVTAVKEYGVVMLAPDQTTVLLAQGAHADRAVAVGDCVKARVLDLDMKSSSVDCSMIPRLLTLNNGKGKGGGKAVSQIIVGSTVEATIELVKDKYLIASIGRNLVCVTVADYNCPYLETGDYTVGQLIRVRVDFISSSHANKLDQNSPTRFYSGIVVVSIHNETSSLHSLSDSTSRLLADKSDSSEEKLRLLKNIELGRVSQWTVVKVGCHELQLVPVGFSESAGIDFRAICHVSNAIDNTTGTDAVVDSLASASGTDMELHPSHPFKHISKGDKIECKVVQLRRKSCGDEGGAHTKRQDSLVSSVEDDCGDEDLSDLLVYLSIVPKPRVDGTKAEINHRVIQWHGRDAVKKCMLYAGVVTTLDHCSCIVSLSPYVTARLNYLDVSNDRKIVKLFRRKVFVGLRLVAAVVELQGVKAGKARCAIMNRACVEDIISGESISRVPTAVAVSMQPHLTVGKTVLGMIDLKASFVPRPPAVMVSLAAGRQGRVCVTELSDRDGWADATALVSGNAETLTNGVAHGSLVKCKVISVTDDRIELSLRESRLNQKAKSVAVAVDALPSVGEVVKGYIANVSTKGCFVRLSQKVEALVYVKDLSDEFIKDPAGSFPVGSLVTARVTAVNEADSRIVLTMKPSAISGELDGDLTRLSDGDEVSGVISKIVPSLGVFVKIDGTALVGLSRVAAAVEEGDDLGSYEVGDSVRARVLSVSVASKKISLGLKSSFFRKQGLEEDDEEDENTDEGIEDTEDIDRCHADTYESSEDEMGDSEDEFDSGGSQFIDNDDVHNGSSEVHSRDDVVDNSDDEQVRVSVFDGRVDMGNAASSIGGSGRGFTWDDFDSSELGLHVPETDKDSDDEIDEAGAANSRKRSRGRDGEKRLEEAKIRRQEADALEGLPERVEDFERLLLAEPNNSFLWIQKMAFHLRSVDLDSARDTATRALRTISFREEDEKFNIWLALLDMEMKFGSQDSLDLTLKSASAESKGKYAHLHVAEQFSKLGDSLVAEKFFALALKKYKYSKKVWSSYQHFRLRIGDVAGAHELLSRSMQSLSRHKHVEVILKFAQGLFDCDQADRARVVFEELLASYPRRADLWHQYVDKEMKLGHHNQSRDIFERMISMKSSTQNMKTVFKKYLAFEIKNGSVTQQETVKQKAREYVESMM